MPLLRKATQIAIAVTFAICWQHAEAADPIELRKIDFSHARGTYQAASQQARSPSEKRALHASLVRLEQGSDLRLLRNIKTAQGTTYRYEQLYDGIPVYGEQIIVHEDTKGNLQSVWGRMMLGLRADVPDVRPRIPGARAISIATQTWQAKFLAPSDVREESAELFIYKTRNDTALLAYVVKLFVASDTESGPAEPTYVIDAISGQIIASWNSLTAGTASGSGGNFSTGKIIYGSGSVPPFEVTYTDPPANSQCAMMASVITVNNTGTSDESSTAPYTFPCPDNTPTNDTNGGFSPLNDLQFHGVKVMNAMSSVMTGTSIGTPYLRGHHVISGGGIPNNAYWRGNGAHFSDGDALHFPWTTRDIVAHELAHGYTNAASGLLYQETGAQSGAIHEAFSDIAAEYVEYVETGTNDFDFAPNIIKNGGIVRTLSSPTLDAVSIDHASNWTTSTIAHHGAGVFNKAFYLIATTPGWDTEMAFRAFALANEMHWFGNTDFNDAACGVEQAATTLSYDVSQVTSAFTSVGVACEFKWDQGSAEGLHGGPTPTFSQQGHTITNGAEPTNGMVGFVARGNISHRTGKRYVEFEIVSQGNSIEFPYSGHTCLFLSDIGVEFEGNAGGTGNWALCWYADANSSPNANSYPWYRLPGEDYPSGVGVESWIIGPGDTIGMAVDFDNGKVWFSFNGSWYGSPSTGSSALWDQADYPAEHALTGIVIEPRVYSEFQNLSVRIRGNYTDQQYALPTGHLPWGE
ncbi:hypothetical protein FKV24_013050 [Lysobacter maris]|uniref:B30.2/SPRY domain-containing protein n=1 Tax=Marilutibacter maris TaxID=1605891 RepID=A0A508AIG6_9GAMM|nr:M4 family metallopeptidase [Lysobacter maris]KAB8178373.1 hypothetical protein FKV24_013050 [Lysobacter maris]